MNATLSVATQNLADASSQALAQSFGLGQPQSCGGAGQTIVETASSWGCLADSPGLVGQPPPNGPFLSGWTNASATGCDPDPASWPRNVGAEVQASCLGRAACLLSGPNVSLAALGDPCIGCNKVLLVSAW